MATRPDRRLTYDDYVDFPEGERYELIDGEVYVVPSPNEKHQRVLGELHRQAANHVKEHGGGRVYIAPFDVVLDPGDVLQPDLVFIADADLEVLTEANVWGTPTWVVEVLSRDTARDRKLKLPRYERFGVSEYWIIDPIAEQIEVYRLTDGAFGKPDLLHAPDRASPLLPPGLDFDLDEIFGG
ncbi:MAG: Uma2 family endonuclease [Actinobacteria bacterium]|nr:Uma2 family endonuclease [Actinomycetota bacterium]